MSKDKRKYHSVRKIPPSGKRPLQGRIVRAFSSNSLVNTMEMTAAIQYILTAGQSIGSQDYYIVKSLE